MSFLFVAGTGARDAINGLQDISIDDLARGAGISRPTFHFYFSSKTAVLLALLHRVAAEAEAATRDVLHEIHDDPASGWRDPSAPSTARSSS